MPIVRIVTAIALLWTAIAPQLALAAPHKAKRPNIIFILNDDQRYDAMGFLDPALETPNMDRMAREGVYFPNAFVTTALCSPSRASILTGQYMHNHGVADNNIKFRPGTFFFPQALQEAGYSTAFIGKWHMGGHGDDPQPGFDHWISFKGQGNYLPVNDQGVRHKLNINGEHVEQPGYITDNLNSYAMDWLKGRKADEPFFLYLSHKAVHADFIPAERHKDLYSRESIKLPGSMADTPENYEGKPMWVKNQRNSWHGVDFPYHSTLDVVDYKLRYNQTLAAVDEGIGDILDYLDATGQMDNTIVVMMGDNGFMFGEHGLIDKRNAYEESMKVPFIAMGGGMAKGRVNTDLIANIDIAPTFLELAGASQGEAKFDGISFMAQLMGMERQGPWREGLNYEYFWEYNYPHTPTTLALRGDRYKYIQYHGVWDTEELYDLQNDPFEMNNLIASPDHQDVVSRMREGLFANFGSEDGRAYVTFTERNGQGAVLRNSNGSEAADFPDRWMRDGTEDDLRDNLKTEGGKKANDQSDH
ncbi:sulfatase [Paraurantiacibacter namhicola]|uniref:Choline-sulfatase n=1 Tax=Paraurantiacibacter namhicola TaxID=645517 RepID=A0A1C7D790_9SPHN|nr:sulfatase [Paraurantiacibacter namhicola]ANU07222.1 Choline-sulfatase [Paraurantiacibacter namhicola]